MVRPSASSRAAAPLKHRLSHLSLSPFPSLLPHCLVGSGGPEVKGTEPHVTGGVVDVWGETRPGRTFGSTERGFWEAALLEPGLKG